jgi:hypothetical protein
MDNLRLICKKYIDVSDLHHHAIVSFCTDSDLIKLCEKFINKDTLIVVNECQINNYDYEFYIACRDGDFATAKILWKYFSKHLTIQNMANKINLFIKIFLHNQYELHIDFATWLWKLNVFNNFDHSEMLYLISHKKSISVLKWLVRMMNESNKTFTYKIYHYNLFIEKCNEEQLFVAKILWNIYKNEFKTKLFCSQYRQPDYEKIVFNNIHYLMNQKDDIIFIKNIDTTQNITTHLEIFHNKICFLKWLYTLCCDQKLKKRLCSLTKNFMYDTRKDMIEYRRYKRDLERNKRRRTK